MTTKTKQQTRTTGKGRPRITKREKLIMQAWREHAEGRVSESDFFRDERLAQTAAQYFTFEERLAMLDKGELPLPSSWGTRFFDAQFLPIAARAIRRRDAMLTPLLADLEANLPEIVEDYTSNEADYKAIMRRIRQNVDGYDGPPTLDELLDWAVPEIASTLTALHIARKVEAENRLAFADVYQRAHRAAWSGVLEVLKSCRHLGATHEVAEELVHVTMTKILCDIENWRDDGEASLPTRVRLFAEKQAMGWRTERIREKQRRGRLLGGVRRRRRELLYPTGARKPSSDVQSEL